MNNSVKQFANKNYQTSGLVWFTYKYLAKYLSKCLGVGLKRVQVVSGYELEINVVNRLCYPVILFLNKHTQCQFKSLIDIVCYDTPGKEQRFFVVYNLLSTKYNSRFRVMTKLGSTSELLSLTGIYRAAGWCEREVFDFFGVFFFENIDLRRILTDYGFKGFPLRKDFPLTGYVDTYYDDDQKRVCYRSLELAQEYRNFKFKSNWRLA